MFSKKRKLSLATKNEFLDQSDSEADFDDGNASEDDGLRKGGRTSKKRRPGSNDDEDSVETDAEEFEENEDAKEQDGVVRLNSDTEAQPTEIVSEGHAQGEGHKKVKTVHDLPDVSQPLLKKNLVASDAAIKKSGVIYLSKIPPYMKPNKLRSLLSPFGTINRLFLVPEDPKVRSKRVRNHGNKKTCYTEGWVEFTRKLDAKRLCELLNGRSIGGKKGSYYRDDVWSLIYLKGFKWHHLTEQIAQENAERTARLRAEISRTTKENQEFLRNVEAAKMLDGMHSKAAIRESQRAASGGEADENRRGGRKLGLEAKRSFKQIPLAKKRQAVDEQPAQVTRVLSKIF
jgi:ESF2/ABP1 family protein